MEITKIRPKSQDFCFADFFLEIFKIHRLVRIFLWIFGYFHSVSIDVLFKFITNFKIEF